MTEREDNVYKAKLAEQAERYDGKNLLRGAHLTDGRASGRAPPSGTGGGRPFGLSGPGLSETCGIDA